MSESEALAKALYPALAGGDRAALDNLLHPDFVGETAAGLPLGLGGRYDGPRAMRRDFWGRIGRAFDLAAEPTEFFSLADGRVVVQGNYLGFARSTGRKVDAAFSHTLSFQDGRIAGLVQVTDTQIWQTSLNPVHSESPDVSTLETLGFEVSEGIASLRLNRPGQANAIDDTFTREFLAVARACATDTSIRTVLISAEGSRFCAGGDLGFLGGLPKAELPAVLDAMIRRYHEALLLLGSLPVPVVTVAQGAVAGGGIGILYASDLVIAASDCKFALGFSSLGLTGDGGSSWHLPRLIGPARAALVFLENRVITAQEALDWGLLAEVVAPEDLVARGQVLSQAMAAGPTTALAGIRTLLRGSWDRTLPEHLEAERLRLVAAAGSANAAEGIAAFIGKRKPTFTHPATERTQTP